jgi:hypothetical protein
MLAGRIPIPLGLIAGHILKNLINMAIKISPNNSSTHNPFMITQE